MPYITVPEHIEITPYIENHVKVDAGTNWNIGNTAVATPIAKLPPPVLKVDQSAPEYVARLKYPMGADIPVEDVVARVQFSKNSFVNRKAIKSVVAALEKQGHHGWIVVGNALSTERHTDALAQKRAKAVADEILNQAKGPVRMEYFGPVDTTGYGVEGEVDIFLDK